MGPAIESGKKRLRRAFPITFVQTLLQHKRHHGFVQPRSNPLCPAQTNRGTMTTVLYLILAAATVFGIATALCLWSLLNAPSASSARIRSADAALQQAIERQAELALPSSPFFSRL